LGQASVGDGVKLEGVGIFARSDRNQAASVDLSHCSILFAFGNGLTMRGGLSTATRMRIHASQADGFNYSHADDDGQICSAIERDCHVSEAGDAATFGTTRDNLNGSSGHSCRVERLGGLYECSQGGDVVDTFDAASPGQASLNYGVATRASRIGIGFMFAGRHDGADVVLERCIAERQAIDVMAADHARVVCRGMGPIKSRSDLNAAIVEERLPSS
jgi:hypothetical protein